MVLSANAWLPDSASRTTRATTFVFFLVYPNRPNTSQKSVAPASATPPSPSRCPPKKKATRPLCSARANHNAGHMSLPLPLYPTCCKPLLVTHLSPTAIKPSSHSRTTPQLLTVLAPAPPAAPLPEQMRHASFLSLAYSCGMAGCLVGFALGKNWPRAQIPSEADHGWFSAQRFACAGQIRASSTAAMWTKSVGLHSRRTRCSSSWSRRTRVSETKRSLSCRCAVLS